MGKRRTQPLHRRAKNYLFPHKGNGYKPHVFRTASVAGFVALALILEGAYFGATKYIFPNTGFLASVLPGALIALTNQDRETSGVPVVTEDPVLDQAAALAAEDMAAKGYFAHVSPDGKSPWYWLDTVGYDYSYAGENLAVDFTDSKDVETAWMNSPTHHANIVKAAYTKIGIGVANGTYEGKDVTFVVQFFATPAAASAKIATPVTAPTPAPTQATTSKGVIAKAEPAKPAAPADNKLAVANAPDATRVLGTEAAPAPSPAAVVSETVTSPTHLLVYIFSTIAVILALLLLIALYVHLSVAYVEVIGGGLLAFVVIVGFLIVNQSQLGQGTVPSDSSQSAAAIEATR